MVLDGEYFKLETLEDLERIESLIDGIDYRWDHVGSSKYDVLLCCENSDDIFWTTAYPISVDAEMLNVLRTGDTTPRSGKRFLIIEASSSIYKLVKRMTQLRDS